MSLLSNPATAGLASLALSAPIIGIGYAIDFPAIESSKAAQAASAKALQRIETCYVLAEGTLQPGQFYVTRDMDAKGRVSETLMPNGERICDRRGPTASIKEKAAAFMRQTSPEEMAKGLSDRFGVDADGQPQIPSEALVYPSKHYKANPAARPPAKVEENPPSNGIWGLFQRKENNHGKK